jgi:hypothetical protein
MHRYPYLPKVARSKRGTILGLTLAVFGFFLLGLVIFHYKATRLMGGHQEQTTAAEAAALAVANDIGKIVIRDPYFGWVSPSNQPATGTATVAADGYPLPVRSINDILATIALDMYIADKAGGGPAMKALAVADYNKALTAQATLVTALQNAVSGGAAAYDSNGNAINLVNDATNAYTANLVRMTGRTSQLQPGTMQVAIGYCQNGISNSPVPHDSTGSLYPGSAPNSKGWYLASVDAQYQTYDFVFAALANVPSIIDPSDWLPTVAGLPYSTPSIVKIDADQNYTDQSSFGTPSQYLLHCTACAEAGSNPNAWPATGALMFGFPDGLLAEAPLPFSLAPALAGSGVNFSYEWALPLDVPGATSLMTPTMGPGGAASLPVDAAINSAVYDWLRGSGPRMVTDIFQNTQLSPSVPTGTPCFIAYTLTAQGLNPVVYNCEHTYGTASNQQLDGISTPTISASSTGQVYDLLIIDNVHRLGTDSGTHNGTPVYDVRLAQNTQYPPGTTAPLNGTPTSQVPSLGWDAAHGGWGFGIFQIKAGGTTPSTAFGGDNTADTYFQTQPPQTNVRPTYPGGGLGVEITLHKMINALPENGLSGG